MRAIVLAAGRGERLGGVTQAIPKPMIKIYGKPILEHNIEWLKSYGIKNIYINLHHLPETIRNYFGDGSRWQVKINYSFEPKLLGTAGAVSKISHDFFNINNDPFLVIYGDNLLQYDLQEVIRFHKQKEGKVTIVLYKNDDVSQSGIAATQEDGRIVLFIEKPKTDEIVSHLVNTGIYVLEKNVLDYIPLGQTLDFGRQIFPIMLAKKEPVYGFLANGDLTAIDTPQLLSKIGYELL